MAGRIQQQNIAGPLAGVLANPLMRFLRLNGTGTPEMADDYSVEAGSFRLAPPPGAVWLVNQLVWLVHVADGPLVAGDYGDLAALVNGFLVRYSRGGEVLDLLDGVPIKTNADLSGHFGWTSTPAVLTPSFDLALVHASLDGLDVGLEGDAGDYLEILVQDDLSDLLSHSVKAIGYQLVEAS